MLAGSPQFFDFSLPACHRMSRAFAKILCHVGALPANTRGRMWLKGWWAREKFAGDLSRGKRNTNKYLVDLSVKNYIL